MGITKRDSSPAHSVLVVDDEADIRELLELTLLRMGLNVTTAGSVKQALEQRTGVPVRLNPQNTASSQM